MIRTFIAVASSSWPKQRFVLMVGVFKAFAPQLHNDRHGPKKHITYPPTNEVRLHNPSIVLTVVPLTKTNPNPHPNPNC